MLDVVEKTNDKSILLNLLTLAINSGFAQGKNANATIVMFIFVSLIIAVNLVVISGVLEGKQTRSKFSHLIVRPIQFFGVFPIPEDEKNCIFREFFLSYTYLVTLYKRF